MRLHQFVALVVALDLSAAFVPRSHASDFPEGSPAFVSSYDAALKAAKEAGKPAVLIFSASWCGPCQANKANVYPSTEVKPFHDKFVWAYLDTDQKANAPALQKFSVSNIPHIQFLSKDGASLGNFIGGTSPQEFAAKLTQVLEKPQEEGAGGSGSKGSGSKGSGTKESGSMGSGSKGIGSKGSGSKGSGSK